MGWLTSLLWGDAPSHFDLQEAFLCMCRRKALLDFKNKKCGLSSGHGLAPSLLPLGVSVHRAQTLASEPETHLSLASLYLEVEFSHGEVTFTFILKFMLISSSFIHSVFGGPVFPGHT